MSHSCTSDLSRTGRGQVGQVPPSTPVPTCPRLVPSIEGTGGTGQVDLSRTGHLDHPQPDPEEHLATVVLTPPRGWPWPRWCPAAVLALAVAVLEVLPMPTPVGPSASTIRTLLGPDVVGASCAGMAPMHDLDLFGESPAEREQRHALAVTVCSRCPALAPCRAAADEFGRGAVGVWAGEVRGGVQDPRRARAAS